LGVERGEEVVPLQSKLPSRPAENWVVHGVEG
jgi:hypothetical protein